MHALPYVIAGTIGLVLVVTFRLKFGTRAAVPFPAWRALESDALGRLTTVISGTEIDLLERELSGFLSDTAAGEMVGDWLRQGATLRILAHHADQRSVAALAQIAAASDSGLVSLFVLTEAGRSQARAIETREFHFAIFRHPVQLWLEGYHPQGQTHAALCEFIPEAERDPRLAARRDDFDTLLTTATQVKLGADVAQSDGKRS